MDYDLNTGAITGIADPNGQVTGKKTTYTYDAIGRITSITHPDGGQTNAYYLNPTTVEVKKLQDSAANVWIDSYTYFDGLLRPKQTRLVDPEGDVYSETTYDALGRVATTTNPHRTAAAPTDGTTTKHYDALGRVTSVVQPDNNSLQTLYSDPGVVTLIDETGRLRRETHDALGRLITVEEPSGGSPGNYPLSSPPAWPTLYSYDVLGNLLRVEQHGSTTDSSQWRVRSFQYDSLSRLTQSNNPETGQINFTYDADGNNITRSDARGVTATRAYDGLNRLVQQSYSDGTPTEAFGYDQTSLWGVSLANTVGRLSSTAAGATGSIVSYDPMGRIVSQFVCLPSNCGTGSYPIAAGYDLAGHQTSLTYPSGRTVTSGYSSAGRSLSSIFTNFAGVSQNYSYYAVPQPRTPGAWGYNPDGSLHQGTFGNGISETYGFNNRLQLNSITASSSSQTWLSKIYGLYDANNNNNGIILSITDGISSSRNQSYQYDAVGRVVAGSQQDGAFNQTFSYDPWGNMTSSGTNNCNPLCDGNNRVSGAPANCTGANQYCYDSAGNMMNDGYHQYAYDGYNRIKVVDGTGATYTYAAGGERVRKDTGGKSTEYVHFA